MRYRKSRTTAKAGVLFVEQIVNKHGSIFRPVHQEDDLGVDGFIEFIHSENSCGHLIAVQIKSGDSYLDGRGNRFAVEIDEPHLTYWSTFMIPVLLVCYSPSKKLAAWTSIRDYVEREKYHDRVPIKKILVPRDHRFDVKALSGPIAGLAHARADERILLKCADMCLSSGSQTRHTAFQILTQHPDSRDLKITCHIARRLITDENIETAKDALHTLGYGVGRRRWSWNPMNEEERAIIAFSRELCSDLTPEEIRRLVELCDDETFHGPQGLGERCSDVINCCLERAADVLIAIASDSTQHLQRRVNALYLRYGCDDDVFDAAAPMLRRNKAIRDVVKWMMQQTI